MKKLFLFGLLPAVIILSGCTINFGSSAPSGPDGGLFKSTSKGAAWAQKSLIATVTGKPGSFGGLNTNTMVMDPSDPKTLYYTGNENGLFYTYDAAESWQQAPALRDTNLTSLAVDPIAHCTLYGATQNRLLKSLDCGRSWSQSYFDNDLSVTVSAIAVDHYDSAVVYIGTSRGEVIQSLDGGKSWQVLNRFDDPVKKVLVSPADSRLLFAATQHKGLYRSSNRGVMWESLADAMAEFPESTQFRDLYLSSAKPGLMVLATNYGILKSVNNGDDWVGLKLLTPEKEAVINSVVISELNTEEIYYVTNTTFYGTADGGQNWATKKLPSNRAGKILLADPQNAGVLYLAVRANN